VKFSETIDNSKRPGVNKKHMHDYIGECYRHFIKKDYSGFTYLDQISNDDRHHYLEAIQYGNNVDDENPTILYPVYDSYANKNGNKLAIFAGVNLGGLLLILMIVGF